MKDLPELWKSPVLEAAWKHYEYLDVAGPLTQTAT